MQANFFVLPENRDKSGFFASAVVLTFFPWEKEESSAASGFAEECAAIPAASCSTKTADDSPSPRGEGRGEVEPFH
jgi:hypothetical protein